MNFGKYLSELEIIYPESKNEAEYQYLKRIAKTKFFESFVNSIKLINHKLFKKQEKYAVKYTLNIEVGIDHDHQFNEILRIQLFPIKPPQFYKVKSKAYVKNSQISYREYYFDAHKINDQ